MEKRAVREIELRPGVTVMVTVERSITEIKGDSWEGRPTETLYIEDVEVKLTHGKIKVSGSGLIKLTDLDRERNPRIKEKSEEKSYGMIQGTPVVLSRESFEKIETVLNEAKIEASFTEWEAYVSEKETKKIEARKKWAISIIESAKKENNIMSNAEYKKWRENYNAVMNEGGGGYIPEHVTVEQVEEAKKILGGLKW